MISERTFLQHPPRVSRSAAGFAMLEVLVTLLILGGGLLAVAKFQIDLVKSNAQAGQRSEAVMLAQQKIESLRSYATLTAYSSIAASSDSVTGTSATYTRSWSVVSHTTAPLYKEVTCIVTWIDSSAITNSVTLNSYIVSNDPKNTGTLITG